MFNLEKIEKYADNYCKKMTGKGFNEFMKIFEEPINFNFGTAKTSSFILDEEGKFYSMTVELGKNANAENVNIDIKNGFITISHKYEDGNVKQSVVVTETIPSDMDEDSMYAEIYNGKVIITADKIMPEESESDMETDNITCTDDEPQEIKINRN